ncbi:hypothetical protein GQ53DRAFT_203461 [Thozetella sp. PMI_491]|nr:hypothetical protein GQ53DRAFT_203461 [Thozetella sp. PMI_491]
MGDKIRQSRVKAIRHCHAAIDIMDPARYEPVQGIDHQAPLIAAAVKLKLLPRGIRAASAVLSLAFLEPAQPTNADPALENCSSGAAISIFGQLRTPMAPIREVSALSSCNDLLTGLHVAGCYGDGPECDGPGHRREMGRTPRRLGRGYGATLLFPS